MQWFWKAKPRTGPDTIFIGDSITEWWAKYPSLMFGPRNPNRGIGGQNTGVMLARFATDVVAASPWRVHIMGGTNDLWHTLSADAPDRAAGNIAVMLDMAREAGIRMLLGSVPPINWTLAPDASIWGPMIAPLNQRLRSLAARYGAIFIDYEAALGPRGDLLARYSDDGVHPNRQGYAVMRKVFLRAT